jgi:hypothetical protein
MTVLLNIIRTVAFGLLFSIFSWISLCAQGEAKYSPGSVWVFEGKYGLKFYSDTPQIDTFFVPKDSTPIIYSLNNASIYFHKHKNFLYTRPFTKIERLENGYSTIYSFQSLCDSSGKIIENGDSLYFTNGRNNSTILLPLNDSIAYFFCIGSNAKKYTGNRGGFDFTQQFYCLKPYLYATKILCNNIGLKVIEKERLIVAKDLVDAITAVKHANGKDWWIIAHERNASKGFIVSKVSNDGSIQVLPPQYIGSIRCPRYMENVEDCTQWNRMGDAVGQMSFNAYGNKLFCVASADTAPAIFDLFDFDRCTGKLSNHKDLNRPALNKKLLLGCSISPDGNNFIVSYSFSGDIHLFSKEGNKIKSYSASTSNITFSAHPYYINTIIGNSIDSLLFFEKFNSQDIDSITLKQINFFGKQVSGAVPNITNYLLPAIPYDFSVDRKPKPYRDTLCIYDSTALGGWYPAGKHLHRWYPTSGLSNDTSGLVTFRPPVITKQDTVYTFYLHTEGRAGGCLEGQSRIDTFRVFVWGNGRGGCRTVSRLDAIPPQVFQIYPNPTNGTLYIKSSWEEMKKVLLYNMAGQVVFERQLSATEATLHIGDLADGTYLCKITTTEGIFTQKVVLIR